MTKKSSDSTGDAIFVTELKAMILGEPAVISALMAAFTLMFMNEVNSTIEKVIKEEAENNWTPPPTTP